MDVGLGVGANVGDGTTVGVGVDVAVGINLGVGDGTTVGLGVGVGAADNGPDSIAALYSLNLWLPIPARVTSSVATPL